ncbi:MAG: GspE/PulE family protein [Pseudomonadota bacterium]
MRPQRVRLGQLLVEQQLISEEQLAQALEDQKRTGRKLGRVLVELGFVSEDEISKALARQLRVPFIDLRHYEVRPDVAQLLPEVYARRFRAVALAEDGGAVKVGMADPTDLFAFDEIGRIVQRGVDLAVVTESQALELIDRVYRRTDEITSLAEALKDEVGDVGLDLAALGIGVGTEDAPVVRLLQTVFEDAVQVRASDIHIEPQEQKLQIRFRIDGVLHLQTEADLKIATAVALRLKLMSGLDIAERRLPHDGRFNIKVRGNSIDVRVSTMPTQYGESVVLRLLNQSQGLIALDNLGMLPEMVERLRTVVHRPTGMVLVTGPTGSGKTTTLYALLREINTPHLKIITVEDPVEYRLPGINQVQVHEKIDLTFGRVLRSALRQDPDVILVGEMRDQGTVETGLRAAITGHIVLSTLHTNDALTTPMRLLDMGAPAYMVAMSLHLVLAQRLLRLNCDNCAEPYGPAPQELEWLAHSGASGAGARFLKGRGCSRCNGTGYLGRTGVYEMLEMTKAVVDPLGRGDSGAFLDAARRQIGGRNLRHHAAQLALAGRTTAVEAMRVSSLQED